MVTDRFAHLISQELHHAYLIEGAADDFAALQAQLRAAYPNAEYAIREFDSFGIDDSRELVRLAHLRSFGQQLLLYRMDGCTGEAQNALLKLFEEPPSNTHFFVCVPSIQAILPTLRSRALVLHRTATDSATTNEGLTGATLIDATPAARIALLTPLVQEKDTHAATALLNSIETELHRRGVHATHPKVVEHIISVRDVLNDKGASLKILMESVALTIPRL